MLLLCHFQIDFDAPHLKRAKPNFTTLSKYAKAKTVRSYWTGNGAKTNWPWRRICRTPSARSCRQLAATYLQPRLPESHISSDGEIIHELGAVRMGSDPRKSALNGYCQAHEVKPVCHRRRLFVRRRSTKRNGGSFDARTILAVWNRGRVVFGVNPNLFRKDACGAWIKRSDYGKTALNGMGWEIDHIMPVSRGGSDALFNLQPLQWQNNRKKGEHFPMVPAQYRAVSARRI